MSAALLALPDSPGAGFPGMSLDESLRALDALGAGECLACGAMVEVATDGRVVCERCGSTLEAPVRRGNQLAMV